MASVRPDVSELLNRGEKARLFPVPAGKAKSQERHTTAVFLACLSLVPALGRALVEPLGLRLGNRSRIQTFTEVVLDGSAEVRSNRPDGLIAISRGKGTWTALVEAKVQRSKLDRDQIESYLQLARAKGIDALITVSNDFAAVPSHHPLQVNRVPKNVGLFHWSWSSVLTHAKLLKEQGVDVPEQHAVLSEFVRFLEHENSGVMRLDSMGPSWKELVSSAVAGAPLDRTSDQVVDTVGTWHQETRDLALQLTEAVNANVTIGLSRAHRDNSSKRIADDAAILSKDQELRARYEVPDAASPITVVANLRGRTIEVSMQLRAPEDRKSTSARVNWLLRQLPKDGEELHIRAYWPRRAKTTQASLESIQEDSSVLQIEDRSLAPASFEVKLVRNAVGRFSQPKRFVEELEEAVRRFYEQVGQRLKRWQPAAPKIAETPKEVEDTQLNESNEATVGQSAPPPSALPDPPPTQNSIADSVEP